jgi:hypothetical protein
MRAFVGIVGAVALLVSLGACGNGGSTASSSGGDPFAPLRAAVSLTNPVKCEGDRCCLYRCSDKNILCVTRAVEDLKKFNLFASCSQVLFPEWFYANDCFIFDLATSGLPTNVTTQCFCGRTATGFYGEYSTYADGLACDGRAAPLPADIASLGSGCDASRALCAAATCTKHCSGRACGPDGCGGQCGTCSSGECNSSGKCGTAVDSCGSCLSSCHGLGSCCTGCGCICESACGSCF